MANKKMRSASSKPSAATTDKPATLKDLLGADTIAKLREQSAELVKAEEARKEDARIKAEEARRAKQKQLDNDFEHLLNTSDMDWHKYK